VMLVVGEGVLVPEPVGDGELAVVGAGVGPPSEGDVGVADLARRPPVAWRAIRTAPAKSPDETRSMSARRPQAGLAAQPWAVHESTGATAH